METKSKLLIGFLVLLISASIVYVTFSNEAKIRVDNDKTTFYVLNENHRWEVSGREYNSLFDGTTKLNRDLSGISVNTWNDSTKVWIQRTTPYKRGPVIIDTYEFDSSTEDIELFPIYHTVEIFNGKGYFYKYEVKDLEYSGQTFKLDGIQTSQDFGKKMKVTWWKGYRLGWIYQSGSMYVKSEKLSDYERFDVRLFDPEVNSFNDTLFSQSYLWFTKNENITRYLNITRNVNVTSAFLNITGFESNFSDNNSFESDFDGWQNTSLATRETTWSSEGDYSIYLDTSSAHQSINKTIDLSDILFIIYDWNLVDDNTPGCAIYFDDIFIEEISDGLSQVLDVQSYYGDYDVKFKCFWDSGEPDDPAKGYLDNLRFFQGQKISYEIVFNNSTTYNFVNNSDYSLGSENNHSDNNYSTPTILSCGVGTCNGWFNETWNVTDIGDPFYRIKLDESLIILFGAPKGVFAWNGSDWINLVADYQYNNKSSENDYHTSLYNLTSYVDTDEVRVRVSMHNPGTPVGGGTPLYQTKTYYHESDVGTLSFSDNYFIPLSPWLEVGTYDENYAWEFASNYTFSETTSDFYEQVDAAINSGACDCDGCGLIEDTCQIPFIFHSNTSGLLRYSALNITYTNNPHGIELNSPIESFNSSTNTISFNCSANQSIGILKNMTLYGNWSITWGANLTNSITGYTNMTNFSQSISEGDGNYKWGCRACDDYHFCEWSTNRTFAIDTIYPLIEFGVGTDDSGTNHTPSANWIYANVSVTELNEANIIFNLSNSTMELNSEFFTNGTRLFNWTNLVWENYEYNVTVCDFANNCNSTETRITSILAEFNVSLSPATAFDFLPDNMTHQQVAPTNQSDSVSILIVHNNQTADGAILIILNDTFANITVWMNPSNNYSNATELSGDYTEIISNVSMDATSYLWMWADYSNALHAWFPALDIFLRKIT